MKLMNYISNLDLNQRSGGWSGVNVAIHGVLSKRFELNVLDPINPGFDYPAKVVSKARRTAGLPGKFHFFTSRRLKQIANLISRGADAEADCDFFHGSTPWILYDSPRPYFAIVDTCFSTYVNVYHDRKQFAEDDLNRIFDTEARWLSRASGVFFGTQWALQQVVDDYSIPPSNLEVVGAAGSMRIPEKDRDPQGLNLLFIGYDFQRKGGVICVEALKLLRQKYPDARLTLVGGHPGPDILAMPGITYQGFLSKSVPSELTKLEELYADASILLLPTSSDIQPLVISEAGYFGCPTVAPKSFGIPDLIEDGVTGILIDLPLSAEAFVDKIAKLVANKAEYLKMRKAVRAHAVANQTWPAVGERIIEKITSVLSDQPSLLAR